MTDSEQREAARQFANKWKNGGNEDQDGRTFWIELLQNIMGVDHPTEYVNFEKRVQLLEDDGKKHTRRIDEYIPDVRVLIEMKGSEHPLDVPEPQSGGAMLTPVQQAERYNNALPFDEKARWIVTCNFKNIWIYDMNQSTPEESPTKVEIEDLQAKYTVLSFLVKPDIKELSHEVQVSKDAGKIVGRIYNAFYQQYHIPEPEKGETEDKKTEREHKLHCLNELCVRLVFCLYAEDTDIFGKRNIFHDYLAPVEVKDCRKALLTLFENLDKPEAERDEYLEEDVAEFPYVNGGLFKDDIEIPQFTQEIKDLIIKDASEEFDWKEISPTIFGAVFESTLNPETRRAGGMHYTSIENIHKVIDPLFLDDLKAEFKSICEIKQEKKKDDALTAFQEKLGSLKFLDPACGSGNFLTESYLSLRRLENDVLREKNNDQVSMVFETQGVNPIHVSIQQFYGIEINDFAVTVAKTALWIAESQMLDETKNILIGFNEDFLPLKTYVNITERNALHVNWNDIIPADQIDYIMGNPPFVGSSIMPQGSPQKLDVQAVFESMSKNEVQDLDYVTCWYKLASEYIQNTHAECCFVSTNSICQGSQVPILWNVLFNQYHIHINFAYQTFRWNSESLNQAAVHCVIIGFATFNREKKVIYSKGGMSIVHHNISPYLIEGEETFVSAQKTPICDVPKMCFGNQPRDGGFLVIDEEEYKNIIEKEPDLKKWLHKYIGAVEFINNKERWCLWLKNASPADIRGSKILRDKVESVEQFRLASRAKTTRGYAKIPHLFAQITQPDGTDYLMIPRVSSERRRYIPIGFMTADIIASDAVQIVPNATLYDFGVLTSNVHMAWMRTVAGRLKSDYRYSKEVVYNTFPWSSPTDEQRQRIEQTAQRILDARALYPDNSLADLYDPLTMPPELRKAHTENDKAVMAAYGFSLKMTEAECVAELMKLYQQLTDSKK